MCVCVGGAGQGQSPQQEAARDQPWSGAHKGCCVLTCPPPQEGPAPRSPSAVSPRCPELPGLVSEGWDRTPALTALVTAPQTLFMPGR